MKIVITTELFLFKVIELNITNRKTLPKADNKLPYNNAETADIKVPINTPHHFNVRFSFVEIYSVIPKNATKEV